MLTTSSLTSMRTFLVWLVLTSVSLTLTTDARAEDGYDLWLRYRPIADATVLRQYQDQIASVLIDDASPTMQAARAEITRGLAGLLGREVPVSDRVTRHGTLIIGTPARVAQIASLSLSDELARIGNEGYLIRSAQVDGRRSIVITANEDVGVLYGVFAFLRLVQTNSPLNDLSIVSAPRVQHRVLNHWDNMNRTVERGYAGFSLWDWQKLPHYLDPRYTDYARANASLGINGTVLTNVNANAVILLPEYLEKVSALADVFRPYGITVYLTARFSAPIEIGGLETADPTDPTVQAWWRDKVAEVYRYIPDFGGFTVKANSEGQPGPQDYGRSHAEGANMLADAVAPHGGIVMWRAFVYDDNVPVDRIRQAYDEFKPLDGTFRDNVLVQVKNGPLDFQPREPFHPLFGGMPETPQMMEFQITQEYLGHGTHLVYLGEYFKEFLDAETFAKGPGSTVARVVDGSLHDYSVTAMAGVANTGMDRNWTSHHFGQANWYAYGRLAWDHTLSSREIAEEWVRMTFSNDARVIEPVLEIMMASREAPVNYMTPLGLAHLMAASHHYGPGPWVDERWGGRRRADWTATYYHRADTLGIGFDRTATGSNAIEQYHPPVRERWGNRETVPDSLLLWFHRVGWDERMRSGRTLWDELVHRYTVGVETIREMRSTWDGLEGLIDERRFRDVQAFLAIQEREAKWWRDSSIAYFQTFSRMPLPDGYEPPEHPLEHYINIRSRFVPGI
jgi:alpha-glucuronidase